MRVLHILHNSLPLICGYSIRSGYIVRLERNEGLELRVVTSAQHPNGELPREEIDGVLHVRTPTYDGPRLPLLRERQLMQRLERNIAQSIREFRPDLVHAHSPVLVGLPALRAARRAGLPFVYEVRDLWENASVDRKRFTVGSPLYRLARSLETHVLRRADAVVTICETLRNELAPRAGDERKVHIIANGVDVDYFSPADTDAALRRELGLEGRSIVLYAGTFQPYEGLDLLVKAMPEIISRVPNAHLLIVGGSAGMAAAGATAGAQESVLLDLVRALNLQDRVTFTGRIPHAKVKAVYTIADVVAYPRLMTLTTALTTPLKPLEAMAMGRSVIVSDVPAMKELVRENETGLAFPAGDVSALADCCTRLMLDEDLRGRLGQAARRFVVSERQWTHLVHQYLSIYAAVSGAAAAPASARS